MFLLTNLFSSSISQEFVIANLHYSRRLLLQPSFYHAPAPPRPNYQLYPLSHPVTSRFDTNVIMVLSVLICALICSLCVNSILRCMLKCSSVINQGLNHNNIITQQKGKFGVDKRALLTFPMIKYSVEEKIQGLDTECVICLSEFEGGEKVRILPKCHHGFHVMCIDKWLSSHSSCPTCRQSLIDTCKKIVGCRDHHSSISSVEDENRISVSVELVPLEREEMVRNYRG